MNYEVYDGKERTQIDSESPDENTGRYRQLEKKRMSFCVDEKANKKIEKSIMLC